MQINEVEKLLNISRANIRYYENEGLIEPERKENGYRYYSNADIAQLKRIIVFRKLGISIPEIKKLFDDEAPLDEVIKSNIIQLEKQISELNGALSISREIEKEKISIKSFDEELFFNKINEAESDGNKFNDILNDCVDFEKNIFSKMWKNVFFINFSNIEKRHGFIKAVAIIFVICVIRGLMCQFVWHNKTFFEAFIYPFELFAIVSIILLPIYLLSKKHQKASVVIMTVIYAVCILLLAAVFGLLLFAIIKSVIN